MRTPLRQRVEAGAALIDQVRADRRLTPWRKKIDTRDLDIADCFACVLAQIFGTYSYGVAQVGLSAGTVFEYGFDTTANNTRPLTRAWRKYIEATR